MEENDVLPGISRACISQDCFYEESEVEPYAVWKLLSILVIGSFVAGVLWTRQMRKRQGDLHASRHELGGRQEPQRESELQSCTRTDTPQE